MGNILCTGRKEFFLRTIAEGDAEGVYPVSSRAENIVLAVSDHKNAVLFVSEAAPVKGVGYYVGLFDPRLGHVGTGGKMKIFFQIEVLEYTNRVKLGL